MRLIIVTACLLVRAVLGNEETNHISDPDIRDAAATSDVGGLANERSRPISGRDIDVEKVSSDSADLWRQPKGGSWRDRSYQEKNDERYESGETDREVGIVSKRSPADWRIEEEILPMNYWCEYRSRGEIFCVCGQPQRFNSGAGKRRKRYARWNIDCPTKRSGPVSNRDRFFAHLHKYRAPVGFASELNDVKRVAEISRVGWKTPFNSWGGKRAGKWTNGDGKESGLLSRKVPSNAVPSNVAQGKLEGRNRWGTREMGKGDAWKEGWANKKGNGPAIPLLGKAEKSNPKKYASHGIVEICSKGLQLNSSAGQTHAFLKGARNAKQVIDLCWMKTLKFVGHEKSCNCARMRTCNVNPSDMQRVNVRVQPGKSKKFQIRRYYRDASPGEFGAAAASPSGFNGIKRIAEINRVQSRIPFNSWGGKRAHRFSKLPDKPRFHLTKDELVVNTDTDTDTDTDTNTDADADADTDTFTSASDQIRKREKIGWQSLDGQRNPFLSWIPFRVYNQVTEDAYDTLENTAQEEEGRGVDHWYEWMPEKKAEQYGQYKKTKFDPWGGKRSLKMCSFPRGNETLIAPILDET